MHETWEGTCVSSVSVCVIGHCGHKGVTHLHINIKLQFLGDPYNTPALTDGASATSIQANVYVAYLFEKKSKLQYANCVLTYVLVRAH